MGITMKRRGEITRRELEYVDEWNATMLSKRERDERTSESGGNS